MFSQILRKKVLSVVDAGGKITFARVWQQGNDGLSGEFGTLSELLGSPDCCARCDTCQNTFLAGEAAGGREGIFTSDGYDFIHQAEVEDIRYKVSADPL